MSTILGQTFMAIIRLLLLAIFAQVVLSWVLALGVRSPFLLTLYRAVSSITEPLMRPLRRVIPPIGMIDITPMVAIIILLILHQVVDTLL